MNGILYGVGIGPGDPELLTLKAVRMIREADVIAVPGSVRENTTAYKITVQAVPEIKDKPFLELPWSMTKDREKLEAVYRAATEMVSEKLAEGKSVAFLTLGDPCVYSTYLYIHQRVQAMGYEAQIVSGIPSFCAAAARLNMGLVEKSEPLHVIPASYDSDLLKDLSGTRVFMKSGTKIGKVKELLREQNAEVTMVENCGMEGERVFRSVEEIPEDAGYYSLIIAKER
ncbi:MAG: precorrin-2 C(20)-methyltransferase [Lachnospiraceae bacterium]